MASDDQEVEAWYLEGWAFYLMAELAHDSPNGMLEGEGLTWEELGKDARDCLETCKNVGVYKTSFSSAGTDESNAAARGPGVWGWPDARTCERIDWQLRGKRDNPNV